MCLIRFVHIVPSPSAGNRQGVTLPAQDRGASVLRGLSIKTAGAPSGKQTPTADY